jgi:rhamnogalacturonyl hydrolase YesR
MAAALIAVQGDDGLWRSSLLDAEEIPIPESSGSGFFTFGLAWGVNNGLLDKDMFLPAVRKGWEGLVWAQQPDGRIGWVQQIGYDPRSVTDWLRPAVGDGRRQHGVRHRRLPPRRQ